MTVARGGVPRQARRRPQAARAVHHRRLPGLGGRRSAPRPPNGADAIEIGIPFSDPVMDGPVIQQASQAALDAGATPLSILDEVADARRRRSRSLVMTYYNTRPPRRPPAVRRTGWSRPASPACILPDLPLEESEPWCAAADHEGVETVMLAAPTAPDERLPRIAARARGFVYSVGLLGVTGERAPLAASATALAARVKAITDVPVLVGVGVSNAEQAVRGDPGRRRRDPGRLGRAAADGGRRRRGRRLRGRGARARSTRRERRRVDGMTRQRGPASGPSLRSDHPLGRFSPMSASDAAISAKPPG